MHRVWLSIAIGVIAFNIIGRTIVQTIFTVLNVKATA